MTAPAAAAGLRRRRHGALALAWLLITATGVAAETLPAAQPVAIEARPISSFNIVGIGGTRLGALDFAGGFELTDADGRIGGLSSLVIDRDGARLVALSDDGIQLSATITRDAAGDPVGIGDGAVRPVAIAGRVAKRKSDLDAEGFDVGVVGGERRAVVAFEGPARIGWAPAAPGGWVGPLQLIDLPDDIGAFRVNKGLEALAIAPPGTALAGGFVTIAEAPRRGVNTPGWIRLADGRWRAFGLVHRDGFDITDAAFLPGGDLLVLERLYGLPRGIGMRIRRLSSADLAAVAAGTARGALDGETLVEAGLAQQIDNMEGMTVWTDPAGRVRIGLVSDDNRSFLQRTLYLEFRLGE
ncbi:esterase-like activity of phytase family protein [Methylobrevis albus]|uniref:Esterase-like activity of phytase family protein n=1 Tax=Methylobrevis albus TaxID=2793297 RepID=A0A931I0U5_9HYPH|nr:esterase-like activity of phytase family protein [Methylobrevis albus]MBH0237284.1 esterase-like activity of phytase family protein [Methylobrevis albus]